jgi:hypothetical protein
MTGWMKLLKDVGMLNEASPESVRWSMRMDTLEAPRLSTAHHPFNESLTLQLSARVGVVGGWRGGFFFSSCIWCEKWTVHVHLDNGHWTFHASFIWARRGGFIFLSANGKAQGALLLFLLSLGGGKDFFFHFSLFPNVFSRCSL